MSKLYPPYIEGSIPAFSDTARGTVLTVPFSMNRAVSKSEISGFSLALKTIQQDKYFIQDSSEIYSTYDLEKQEVYFNLNNIKDKLKIGQHYKVQIAYRDNNGITGYYSTVGIVKYTATPTLTINNLERNGINRHFYNYIGTYTANEKDITEKAYAYKFVIYDNENNIIHDTDFLIHNNSNNLNIYESYDEFLYGSDLEINKNYYIRYIVKTNNNMIVQSPKYKIIQRQSVTPEIITKPKLELNFDNGYVKITLDHSNLEENGEEKAVSGAFMISRTTDFINWENIYKFSLLGEYLSNFEWKDFTVEQGKKYVYSIQQYNDYDLYSERILSNEIYVDFEDAFLFDGERQLKIRYNPKINSFKTDYLESKIDTIGSKFPFIFRNGNVAYKEFPISGLISYQMDEDNLFKFNNNLSTIEKFNRTNKPLTQDIENYEIKTTNLIGYNISAERNFKLEVLDWLNNGKPKLFRSPSEGNYIVRLMNNSLSPEDGLGRMLHTFNSTAYEIADCNYKNLNNYNFISIKEPEFIQDRWMTVDLSQKSKSEINSNEKIELIKHNTVNSIHLYDMTPGDIIFIDGQKIVIGSTGEYKINLGTIIQSVQISTGIQYSGFLTYNYKDSTKNTFNTLINVNVSDIPAKQFIGYHENILTEIEDIKKKVLNFYYLLFEKRNIGYGYVKTINNDIYRENNNIILYRDTNYSQRIDEHNDFNELNIFEDPLLLYHYKQEKLKIQTDNNKSFILENYSKIEWPIDDYKKELAQKQFIEDLYNKFKIYYIKVNNKFIPAAQDFNPNLDYYEKKLFDCYWDSFNKDIIYLSEESYKQIKIFEEENNCKIITKIQICNNKAWIDNNEIDVTDSNYYIVKSLSDFEKVELSCGIVLSCGYQLQNIVFGEEKNLKDYELIQNLQKLLNTVYLDSVQDTENFYELVNKCDLNIEIPNRYDIIIDAANTKLKEVYPQYIKQLEEVHK